MKVELFCSSISFHIEYSQESFTFAIAKRQVKTIRRRGFLSLPTILGLSENLLYMKDEVKKNLYTQLYDFILVFP